MGTWVGAAVGVNVGPTLGACVAVALGAVGVGQATVAVGALGLDEAEEADGADGAQAATNRTSVATRPPIRRACVRSELVFDMAVALQQACSPPSACATAGAPERVRRLA